MIRVRFAAGFGAEISRLAATPSIAGRMASQDYAGFRASERWKASFFQIHESLQVATGSFEHPMPMPMHVPGVPKVTEMDYNENDSAKMTVSGKPTALLT